MAQKSPFQVCKNVHPKSGLEEQGDRMRLGLRRFVICREGHGERGDLLIVQLDQGSEFDLWLGRFEGGHNRSIVGRRYH